MSVYKMDPYRDGPTFELELFEGEERYEFRTGGTVLFEGHDFRVPPCYPAYDCEESARALMGFLSLRPGDTDPEYFDDYTPAQMEYCQGHGETLGMYALDEDPWPFDSITD